MSAHAAGSRTKQNSSAYASIYDNYVPTGARSGPTPVKATPFALDFDPSTVEGDSIGKRRPKGMTREEQAQVERTLQSKLLSPSQARDRFRGGTVKSILHGASSTDNGGVLSTGKGYRVKGSTDEEMAVFTAKMDENVTAAVQDQTTRRTTRQVPAFIQDVDDYLMTSRQPRQRSVPAGRRLKGMSKEEASDAWNSVEKPSAQAIRAKMVSGNWRGPSEQEFPDAPKSHHDLSMSQETSLRIASAVGLDVGVAPLRKQGSEEGKRELNDELQLRAVVRSPGSIRHNMMKSHWGYSSNEGGYNPDETVGFTGAVTRVDESVASKAVRRASTHKERAHAMMSSSIGWSQPQPPMTPITTASRTTSQTFSYSDDDGDVYSSVDHVSGSGYQSSVQRITVVPPPVPIYDDAPMSARVRMQRAMQSSWNKLPTTHSAGSNDRSQAKIDFIETDASRLTARQRFQQSTRSNIQFG